MKFTGETESNTFPHTTIIFGDPYEFMLFSTRYCLVKSVPTQQHLFTYRKVNVEIIGYHIGDHF